MEEPSEPRSLGEMTEEERIEAADRTVVREWLEEQTKGISPKRQREKIENFKKVFDELYKNLPRWKPR